jgi:uncharacterized protein (DUF488 family)
MALFHTLGHSTRPLAELVDILKLEEIGLLVDVRAIPRSRANPQFNPEVLPPALREQAIAYVHLAELGGRRGRQREIGASPNTFWQNPSFRNFADYAMTVPFRQGLARLRRMGEATPCAIMCSELLWWRCHRRIIADYLMLAGETVVHIFAAGKKETARPTPAAQPTEDGSIVYVGEGEGI